jgi:hypothetical protein
VRLCAACDFDVHNSAPDVHIGTLAPVAWPLSHP